MRKRRQASNYKKGFKLAWGIMMIVIYVSVAYLLVFTPLFRGNIPAGIRITFGLIFITYGTLRGYRLWKEQ